EGPDVGDRATVPGSSTKGSELTHVVAPANSCTRPFGFIGGGCSHHSCVRGDHPTGSRQLAQLVTVMPPGSRAVASKVSLWSPMRMPSPLERVAMVWIRWPLT